MEPKVKEELLRGLSKAERVIKNSQLVVSVENNFISLLRENIASKYVVVFLVHHFHAWYAVSDLYRVMDDSPTFLPIVVSIPHGYGHPDIQGEIKVHEFLTKEGVPHVRFNFEDQYRGLYLLKKIAPDVLLRQEPWEHSIPSAYSIHNLSFTRILYTDYGIEIFDGLYGWKHYQTPLHYKAWMILCANDLQKKYYLNQNPSLRSLRVTGYPKYDTLCRRMKEGSFWPVSGSKKSRYRIIYAPHHTVTKVGPCFATFHRVYKEILRLASRTKEVEIVFRPHPELLERPAPPECPNLKEILSQFLVEWDKLPNTAISMDGDYALLFSASDCMITDGISFLGEYPLTGKPCIFLENTEHWPLNVIGKECVSATYRLTDVKDLSPLVDKLIKEKKSGEEDTLFKQRKKVIRFLRPYPGQAAQKALKDVEQKLDKECHRT